MADDNKPNKDLIKLGKRIKELRVKAGFTSYDVFAYEKGFSRSLYGRWEQGANITYENLIKIIKAHKMTPEEFFKGVV